MANVSELTARNFEEETAQGLALVDFWAPWCMPCLMQGPILERVAAGIDGKARVAKVNVDDHPSLANRFSVEGIPTILLLKDGEVRQRFVGVQDEATLTAAIESYV